ncbi:uncharacterized protein LACBIDRAFT_313082 [Laccaria bicolor S238N-H82]|uniref:Predicted protein n=1 Tax=Laccaria bicolor (strain S238N-H82 / ATCC MYA-4686) TaxID=486041 RepID=B0DXH5_LACBS|nr:uncharacterized protein LACBIDRAFT_313082 [Laccaria bicolor S238N-H82]EDR00619.1 predicted protein [Laccaria bicolor S238N-H82]|eukprot:XP_001888628.1 predicted protein [Laccaria bicolor S238N-H82]
MQGAPPQYWSYDDQHLISTDCPQEQCPVQCQETSSYLLFGISPSSWRSVNTMPESSFSF